MGMAMMMIITINGSLKFSYWNKNRVSKTISSMRSFRNSKALSFGYFGWSLVPLAVAFATFELEYLLWLRRHSLVIS